MEIQLSSLENWEFYKEINQMAKERELCVFFMQARIVQFD